MQKKEKVNPKISLYQNWIKQNGHLKGIAGMEYFGQPMTFEEIDKMIDIYARAFKSLRNDKNSSVTICGLLTPSTVYSIYALNKMGVRTNFVGNDLLSYDGNKYLNKNDTETLLLLDRFYPLVAEELKKTKVENVIVSALGNDTSEQVKEKLGGTDFIKNAKGLPSNINFVSVDEFVEVGKSKTDIIESVTPNGETTAILYTGGSTGIPKGVEFTNEGLAKMYNLCVDQGYDYEIGDRNLCLIPPNHPTSFVHCLTNPWLWGVTNVLQPIYNKYTFLQDLRDLKVQFTTAAPSHYQTLLQTDIKENELSHVRRLFTGGEPMTMETAISLKKVMEKAGVENPYPALGYGMSEIGPLAIFDFKNPNLLNKVGKPAPGVTVRIVDGDGNLLGANERGNLEVKTPCRMKGYFKQPKLTKEFFTEDGYAKTGDISVRDEDGNYTILGRASDSFVAPNKERIYLFDIENSIYEDPAILEAEVIKLPVDDGVNEYVPLVHMVLKPEYKGKEMEVLTRVNKECNKKFTGFANPRGYKIRDEFGTNEVTTKRDYMSLIDEREDYYRLINDKIVSVIFPKKGKEILQIIQENDIEISSKNKSFVKKLTK